MPPTGIVCMDLSRTTIKHLIEQNNNNNKQLNKMKLQGVL